MGIPTVLYILMKNQSYILSNLSNSDHTIRIQHLFSQASWLPLDVLVSSECKIMNTFNMLARLGVHQVSKRPHFTHNIGTMLSC